MLRSIDIRIDVVHHDPGGSEDPPYVYNGSSAEGPYMPGSGTLFRRR